jgi:hypothetical protein
MQCASKWVDLNEDEDEEIDFAEEENLLERTSFQHVAKSRTSTTSSAQPQQQQQQKKKRRVRKANTNIIEVALGTLTEDVTVATGDPLICKCGAAFSHLDVQKMRKKPEEEAVLIGSSSTSDSETTTSTTTSSDEKGKEKSTAIAGEWVCSFCSGTQEMRLDEEELPKEESMDYILEPPTEGVAKQANASEKVLIFCIDISGSMCVTTELRGRHQLKGGENLQKLASLNTEGADQWMRGQRRDVTYVSRLQSVQAAVDAQLAKMEKEEPNRRVGIVTFNNEVTIVGDGLQLPTTITGDKLYSYEQLMDLGKSHSLRAPIKQTKNSLSEKLFALEESGATALGPALVVSIGLAGETPGSEVVVCTDGLSNIGLGQLDEVNTAEKRREVELFYEQLGNYAKDKGVVVNIISIKGTDCSLENLGTLAELTSGEVNVVDPLTITQEFSSILSLPTIATHVGVKLLLHRGLFVRDDAAEDPQHDSRLSQVERDVGNVTSESSFTFEFGVRTAEEMAKLEIDTKNLKTLPFQLQIRYTKLNGMKCMRVISKEQPVTYDKQLAEREANIDVLGLNCVQQAAKIAQKGDYTRARLHNFLHMQMLDRATSATTDESQRVKATVWGTKQGKFEKKLNKVQIQEQAEGLFLDNDDEDDEDDEAAPRGEKERDRDSDRDRDRDSGDRDRDSGRDRDRKSSKKEVRFEARKARRDDKTANMLWNLRSKRHK